MYKNRIIIGTIILVVIILIGIFLYQYLKNSNQREAQNTINQIQEQQAQFNETDNNNENAQLENTTGNEAGTNQTNEIAQEKEQNMNININNKTFNTTIYDNQAVNELKDMLPMTITMQDLNRNEKYHYLSSNLTTNVTNPGRIEAGDIMLYGANCLVIFYESFSTSYSYTPIGKIENVSELKETLGTGNVTVRFE